MLSVLLPMLLVAPFHHHADPVREDDPCESCSQHKPHPGHLTAQICTDECLVCRILYQQYTTSAVLTFHILSSEQTVDSGRFPDDIPICFTQPSSPRAPQMAFICLSDREESFLFIVDISVSSAGILSGSAPSAPAAAFIRVFNRKLLESPEGSELSWSYWFFSVINTADSLQEIDAYAQDCLRFLVSGKRTKGRYDVRYEDLKKLGYRSLVNAYYKMN